MVIILENWSYSTVLLFLLCITNYIPFMFMTHFSLSKNTEELESPDSVSLMGCFATDFGGIKMLPEH